jgi:uncharacterized membrane protein
MAGTGHRSPTRRGDIVAPPRAARSHRCPEQETVMTADHRVTHRFRHPVNQKMVEDAPLGARIADFATHFLGSWKFIVFQTAVVIVWIAINVGFIAGIIKFDPYPFILLNLAFSTQAAYAAPLILLAGNRSAEQDRLILEQAATEADVEEKQNDELLQGNTEILKRVETLEVHILNLEQTILGLLKSGSAEAPPPA